MLDKTVRCDNCGSEAWVTIHKSGDPAGITYPVRPGTEMRLDFCSHHYNKHSLLLHAQGWYIHNDERGLINSKPSPSANAPGAPVV